MEVRYFPFLKCKQNEILALTRLDANYLAKTVPVFDIAANTYEDTNASIKAKLDKAIGHLSKAHSKFVNGFYIDCFDLDPRLRFEDGSHPYQYLIEELHSLGALPVFGLDRELDHIEAVTDFCKKHNKSFSLRLLPEDLLSPEDTCEEVVALIDQFSMSQISFSVFFDLRCLSDDDDDIVVLLERCRILAELLHTELNISVFVVSGSSMPQMLTDFVKTGQTGRVIRKEFFLWGEARAVFSDFPLSLGDYSIVSPEYVEVPPYIYQSIMAAKIIYSEDDCFHVFRGNKLESHGYGQYRDLAANVITNAEYRDKDYCYGDKYIYEVANLIHKTSGSPGSWLCAGINCHMKFSLESCF